MAKYLWYKSNQIVKFGPEKQWKIMFQLIMCEKLFIFSQILFYFRECTEWFRMHDIMRWL